MTYFGSSNFENRIEKEINYICNYGYTIREVAVLLKVSKSTVHADITFRLKKYSKEKYLKVRKVLDYHLQVKHIRWGQATKRKYIGK